MTKAAVAAIVAAAAKAKQMADEEEIGMRDQVRAAACSACYEEICLCCWDQHA